MEKAAAVGDRQAAVVEVKARVLAAWDVAGGTNPVPARVVTAFARSAAIASLTRLDNAVWTGPVQSVEPR
ncbi:MAG: hypothetical protein P8Z00_00260 [Anaerolineales bacterium]